ncbi:MAG TPA: NAD-dependent epimerase/dehydratase family protein [Vicinamibacterales bacterium]|jgi:nucleoside-diphosphate-sugar epimerase|nr:NAD-dependent epimerase/dehydratase family protein [Vicinamibacterales bacterium]
MRIFLTGATGYIGSAVTDALLRSGHEVTALVREPEKAEQISGRGVTPIVGELSRPTSYAAAAETADSIIHTALEDSPRKQKVDRQAIDTLIAAAARRAAAGLPACVVYTSGTWVLGETHEATEEAALNPIPLVSWRPEHEQVVLQADRQGVRPVVIRPGVVYGGARGIVGDLLKDAANGLVRVVGTGQNHWACIYDRDLADLYVRVSTMNDAAGIFHANDEADESVDDIVAAISQHAKMPPDVRHMPIEEARKKMGPYADALALDQIVRSPRARALGWAPTLRSVAGSVARLLEEFRTARAAA